MGVYNMINLLKGIEKNITLRNLRGKSIAIDGGCWLHKGIYNCDYNEISKGEF